MTTNVATMDRQQTIATVITLALQVWGKGGGGVVEVGETGVLKSHCLSRRVVLVCLHLPSPLSSAEEAPSGRAGRRGSRLCGQEPSPGAPLPDGPLRREGGSKREYEGPVAPTPSPRGRRRERAQGGSGPIRNPPHPSRSLTCFAIPLPTSASASASASSFAASRGGC